MEKKRARTLKNRAWKMFSKYIRLRDCLRTTGRVDMGRCVTCGGIYPYDELQAGHAIGGRNNSILFDEELVNAQCRHCNGFMGGRYDIYEEWFIKRYGREKWEEKVRLSNQIIVDTDYEEVYNRYKKKCEELIKKS